MIVQTINPQDIHNLRYHWIGAGLMVLNSIRHKLSGYTTPRTFPMNEIQRAIDYDFQVVDGWMRHAASYAQVDLKGKTVLELGPGADLGIGLILLAMGAQKYIAFDAHELAKDVPDAFYEQLFERLGAKFTGCNIKYLREQLHRCQQGKEADLCYAVDKAFDISKIGQGVDLVFSQAAFEHFMDPKRSFEQLSGIVKKDGLLISEVDLKTHTRWIKDKDPLNIYRYGPVFWDLCKFNGAPNRVRSWQYKVLLERFGWENVEIRPLCMLDAKYVEKVKPTLNRDFRIKSDSEMQLLSIMLMARKG